MTYKEIKFCVEVAVAHEAKFEGCITRWFDIVRTVIEMRGEEGIVSYFNEVKTNNRL